MFKSCPDFVFQHVFLSLIGLIRLLFQHPFFAVNLAISRFRYFFKRKFEKKKIITPDGYEIESASELISYWSFFVEREIADGEWIEALMNTSQPLVVDVGANAGLFSHFVWNLKPDVEIVALEPLVKMAEKIAKWERKTKANLVIHNKAVSDHVGTMHFFAATDHDTAASLKPREDSINSTKVPVITLDSVIPPDRDVLLAKFDVEGAEVEALAGAQVMLSRTRFLIIEAHTAEALKAIRKQLGVQWQCRRIGGSDYFFWQDVKHRKL